jgi:N-acetylglucosamine-6-sulfatase
VARLRTWLEETKQLDNTIIVFMGDNGLLEGEHGMVDKRTAHEASLRIPIIVRYPGLTKQAKAIPQQVLTVDLAPSLLELCSAPALSNIDGKSWVKLIQSGDSDWRTSWVYHYNYEKQFPYTPNVRALRTDGWKYIRYPHGDGSPDKHLAELYDLKNDPGETKNLIHDPKQASKVEELKAELVKQLAAVGLNESNDKMPLDEGIKSELPDQKIR